ncbi:conjugal transfer protein [Carnobacterium divergens]|uniref:conjugal transfer protein n=1 Tax=Carnobacterium divergens TaxID=2748 RepID=UPI0028901A50|nr:conjugal transfer protein [Carnobacterium divergens]MDT2010820.1 conjugal transfer protein [Carnobacterium divergens]
MLEKQEGLKRLINSLFIGAIVILILIVLIFGIKIYYDVSLEQRKKKFEYIFKIIMKNGSEYEYHFYSNSNKKNREYLLKNFIMENDREIAVEEDGYDSYYPLNEVAKMRMSCRPAKQKVASGRNKKSEVDFDRLFSEENVEKQENEMETGISQNNTVSRDDLNDVSEESKPIVPEKEKVAEIEEKAPIIEESKNKEKKPYEQTFEVPEKKKLFSEFRKVEKTSKRDTFKPTKTVNSKMLSIVVCVLILFVSFSGVFAFLGVRATNGNVKELKSDLTVKTKSTDSDLQLISDSLVESYLNPFVVEYMTISNNKEALEKRNNQLKNYFSFTTDFPTTEGDRRLLTNKALYDVEKKKEYYLVKYVVNYDLFSKSVGSDGKVVNDKVSTKAILTIPVNYEKGKFTIIDFPYFSDLANLQSSKVIDLPTDVSNSESASSKDTEKINEFLKQFLAKYATGKKEDLAYMMETPEGLNGLYDFKESTNKVYKTADSYTVLSKVTFVERGSTLTHIENMKFNIINKDGKYFITKLDHVLGGK